MSSKKYKGKMCTYCGVRPSASGDHIFAREFFPLAKRTNLPQVPACDPCNNNKAALEHYLTTVLPFGGRHGDALSNLATMVPRRLTKNAKLYRELAQRRGRGWQLNASGVIMPTMTLPFEAAHLERLAAYITKGLIWHHWNTILPSSYDVLPICLNAAGRETVAYLFSAKAQNMVQGNFGDGAFVYRGAQGNDPAFTIWEMSLMGGIVLAGDPSAPEEYSSTIGVLTGPRHMNLPSLVDASHKNSDQTPEGD